MQNAKMQNRWCNVLVFNEMMFCVFANGFAKHPNIPFLEAQTRPFYAQKRLLGRNFAFRLFRFSCRKYIECRDVCMQRPEMLFLLPAKSM